jgi:hypothetical protein
MLAVAALWIAVHRLPWLGPSLANGLRRVLGVDAVTRLEQWAYVIEDHFNRLWRRGERPKAHWTVPSTPVSPPRAAAPNARFRPRDVGAFNARFAAPGDGIWVPVADPRHPQHPPLMYKTLVHPDGKRPWAEVFVVAIDASATELWLLAGTEDPTPSVPEARGVPRPGRIPDREQSRLIAAFNGGFKTEHGGYGMKASGVTLVAPRSDSCTVAGYADGTLRVATWSRIADSEPRMRWWRQAPPCMVEDAKLHVGLVSDATTRWGAALGGETAIRRSAIGLDSNAATLFVAVTEHTTARALAQAMIHVGSAAVAQLDVNWSYPKFVVYESKGSGRLAARGLFPGFVFREDDYVRGHSPKDFFYLLRR